MVFSLTITRIGQVFNLRCSSAGGGGLVHSGRRCTFRPQVKHVRLHVGAGIRAGVATEVERLLLSIVLRLHVGLVIRMIHLRRESRRVLRSAGELILERPMLIGLLPAMLLLVLLGKSNGTNLYFVCVQRGGGFSANLSYRHQQLL